MKHGSIKAVCLVVLVCMVVLSVNADEKTVDLTSIVLESFNGETSHEWNDGKHPRSYDFSWALDASKFASKTTDADGNEESFPKFAYVDAWPVALFGYNREGNTIKSFGINGRFDRRGYNWIDLYPSQGEGDDAKAFEIPMPGRVRYLDLWVWGSNLEYYIEAYLRDFQGVVHIIRLGDIAYTGWKNLRANIPNSIPQSKRVLPSLAQMSFIKFRIWTQPVERVDNFYIYFKQLKILTDTFESLFDGDELADPDRIPEFWAGGDGNSEETN
ncbi:MAG: flagellar filament outer layer protein FlaA [Treponema sp.]|nr:flagellar filament outer layer protein FlaA [Treponema sp.]